MAATFQQRVITVITHLHPGDVVSYGEVAAMAGRPGAARAVGSILARTSGVPWWRVVMANGRLAPGKEETQARLLREEGVPVSNGRAGDGQRRPASPPS